MSRLHRFDVAVQANPVVAYSVVLGLAALLAVIL